MFDSQVCIFCGDTPTTIEDVLSSWMHDYFPKQHRVTQIGVSPQTGQVRSHAGLGFLQQARIVCHDCNHHWMSNIETWASKWLKLMMFQDKWAVPLTPLAQRRVATWGVLKALTSPYLMPGGNQVVVPEHYAEFRHRKMPWNHVVLVARYDGGTLPMAHTWSIYISHEHRPAALEGAYAYGITVNYGTLVVQVLGWNDAARTVAGLFCLPAEFVPYVIKVWPPDLATQTLSWPPPRTMDVYTLLRFVDVFEQMER